MSDEIKFTTKKLDQVLKAFKGRIPTAKVGIIGANNRETASSKTPNNATIGAAHEFGSPKRDLPQRSFLRVPIADNLENYLEKSGAFDKNVVTELIKAGSLTPWMKKVAVVGKQIVLEAFDTGGFGKWKPSVMTDKKNKQTLVETQQLRNSITEEVKE